MSEDVTQAVVRKGEIPPGLDAPAFDERAEERVCINGCLYLRADFAARGRIAAAKAMQEAAWDMAEWIDVALDDMGLGQSVCKATKDALAAALANYRALNPETP